MLQKYIYRLFSTIIRRIKRRRYSINRKGLLLLAIPLLFLGLVCDSYAQTSLGLDFNGADGITINGIDDYDYSGYSLASGDINGDGTEDVIIGAYYADPGGNTDAGETYVVFGQTGPAKATIDLSSLDGSDGFVLYGIDADDQSGISVSSGDINGDNIDDVIIGANQADPNDNNNAGETYIVFGKNNSFSASVNLSALDGTNGFVLHGTDSNDESGFAVGSGDINGDGIDDVIVGAPNANLYDGETYIFFGKNSGFNSTEYLSALDGTDGFTINGVSSYSGEAVFSGDINGDDIDDVIIGASGADVNGRDSGQAYIVFGKNSGMNAEVSFSSLDGSNGFKLNGAVSYDEVGESVSSGDVNGDGIEDVIVGAIGADPNGARSGAAYVVFGKSSSFSSSIVLSSLDGTDGFVANGISSSNQTGKSVSSGDVNADGVDDVIVGAFAADVNGANSGASYVVFGKTNVFGSSIELSSLDGSNGFALTGGGSSYSGAATTSGDINSDGIDDVIIGAYGSGASSGRTFVYFNRAGARITGTEGFRTLSASVSGSIFNELLGPLWTQGFTGSDAPQASTNVWVWDEEIGTSGDWTSLEDQNNDNLAEGQGFLFYMFRDDNGPETAGDAGFPKDLVVDPFFGDAQMTTGSVSAVSGLEDGRFYLAGNPFNKTIDWDYVTTSGLSSTIYVYDHTSSAWQTWNGSSGDLSKGLISPFQGFFIEGMGGNGSLTIEESDITSLEGSFFKNTESDPMVLELTIENDSLSNKAWVQIDETASSQKDHLDGLELQPLSDTYIQLATVGDAGRLLNINALPADEMIRIPLQVKLQSPDSDGEEEITLSWNGLNHFPENWELELVDTKTQNVTPLLPGSTIDLEIASKEKSKSIKTDESSPPKPVPIVSKSKQQNDTRYMLQINTSEGEEQYNAHPSQITLLQNYPNPFNPATVIEYAVPEESQVKLAVFNILGREVATLVQGVKSAGRYEVNFNASELSSGLYVYRLKVGSRVITKKMMLIK